MTAEHVGSPHGNLGGKEGELPQKARSQRFTVTFPRLFSLSFINFISVGAEYVLLRAVLLWVPELCWGPVISPAVRDTKRVTLDRLRTKRGVCIHHHMTTPQSCPQGGKLPCRRGRPLPRSSDPAACMAEAGRPGTEPVHTLSKQDVHLHGARPLLPP